MGTATELLKIAASQIGYTAAGDPERGTKYGRWYAELTGNSYYAMNGVAYCAMFVSWVLAQADVKCPYFPSAIAFDEQDKSAMQGRYVSRFDLMPADVVSFDWNGDGKGDHVGFVEKVYPSYIQTIEGNTGGGAVMRRTRSLSNVICGIRPYFTSAPIDPDKLTVDGEIGKYTIAEWQRQTGAVSVNKWIGGQSERSARYHSALIAVTYDGGGSRLVAAVQKKVGVTADGYWGYDTSGAIQAWLTARGYKVTVDHYFGRKSAMALQQSLNDGKWR